MLHDPSRRPEEHRPQGDLPAPQDSRPDPQKDEGSPRHVTAEDVYRHLLTEGMDIGLATVYRVLTQFEHAGLLQRHFFESGKAIFELNEGKHHDHLVCLQCGRVEEFFDAEIEKRDRTRSPRTRLCHREHALYLYADCNKADCPHPATAATAAPSNPSWKHF
jgi:Fur family ferric uptake transcriptional regulator